MVAVGLPGVFKYGAKFMGYLVAVVVAAGVLVGGGAVLAAAGGVNLAAPSLASIETVGAIAGTVLALLGAVVGLSGLFGLAYKLLADAASAAIASASETAAAPTAAESDEQGNADDADDSDADRPAVAPEADETPLDGEDTTGTVTEDPATDRPVDDAAVREPPEPPATEPETPTEQPSEASGAGAAGPEQPTADDADSAPSRTDVESHPHAEDFVAESTADEDWTDSKYATGTQTDGDEEPASPADPANDDVSPGAADVETAEQDRAEWTPPDPAEFEQSTEPADDSVPDNGGEAPADEVVGADDTESGSDDAVRTWDDVQSASSGNGLETDQGTTDVGQAGRAPDEPTDAVDLTGGDDASQDLFAQDEPNFADPEPDESGGGDGMTEDDDEDDDLTLADEGVSSFEVEGDDDPLGDRLSGGD